MSTLDTSCGPQRLSSRPRARSGTIRASLPQPQPQPQPQQRSADDGVAAQWLRLSVAAAATERPCRPVAVSGAHSGASRRRQCPCRICRPEAAGGATGRARSGPSPARAPPQDGRFPALVGLASARGPVGMATAGAVRSMRAWPARHEARGPAVGPRRAMTASKARPCSIQSIVCPTQQAVTRPGRRGRRRARRGGLRGGTSGPVGRRRGPPPASALPAGALQGVCQ